MTDPKPLNRFKKISIAFVSAVLTVWFCSILEGISVFADENGTASMEIEVTVEPEGLQPFGTELTFTIEITGEGTAPYDYEIEYGDEATDSETSSATSYEFTHTYTEAGEFTVTALVMDDESEWGVVEFEYQVAEEAPKQCGDLLDNDSDGLTDYPSDPGCTSEQDDDEYNSNSNTPNTGSFYQDLDSFLDDQTGSDQNSDTNTTGTGQNSAGQNTGTGTETGTAGQNTGTGTGTAGQNTGTGTAGTNNQTNTQTEGTLGQTPGSQTQDQATLALQNSATGQTSGTGPETLIYLLFPGLFIVINRLRALE